MKNIFYLLTIVASVASAQVTTLINEDFNGFFPSDWTVDVSSNTVGSPVIWEQMDSVRSYSVDGQPGFYNFDDSKFLVTNNLWLYNQSPVSLSSPQFTLSAGADSSRLSFNYRMKQGAPNTFLDFRVKVTNGADTVVVFFENQSSSGTWDNTNLIDIDLSGYEGETLTLIFEVLKTSGSLQFTENENGNHLVAIDNILVQEFGAVANGLEDYLYEDDTLLMIVDQNGIEHEDLVKGLNILIYTSGRREKIMIVE